MRKGKKCKCKKHKRKHHMSAVTRDIVRFILFMV